MDCPHCQRPVAYWIEQKTCNCCGTKYQVFSYRCEDCHVTTSLYAKLEHKERKRGIGKTN